MAVIAHRRAEDRFGRAIPGWKRGLDLVVGTVIFACLVPLFLMIGLYIKLVSPGPVFFSQKRVGRAGRLFTMWKFRTMHVGNDTSEHQRYMASLIKEGGTSTNGSAPAMHKLDGGNPAIIPFGKLLRSSAIDELPQLINVLKGEMSLVGPRPVIPYEVDEYLRWHRNRFDVVPGMTGLWQVSGKNRLSFTEMIRLDIRYGRECSPWLDLRILLRTPAAILDQIRSRSSKAPVSPRGVERRKSDESGEHSPCELT